MIIERLKPIDFDATIDLFDQYYAEAVESIPSMADEYDEESLINFVRTYASHWQHSWFVAFAGSTRPVGFVAGTLINEAWNEKILNANIDMIYLHPEHRSMENFKQLVDHFTNWATSAGARRISAGDIGINPERTEKLYRHLGFEPACFLVKAIEL